MEIKRFDKGDIESYEAGYEKGVEEERSRLIALAEGMKRKTNDVFELMVEIRQEEIKDGWATADVKAGYNQALKDFITKATEK